MNDNAQIVAAYDGACPPWRDAWGYPLEGRTYNADSMKFKYTGKELDKENLYDYFGARYYDSRIGRWGQVDPLLDKYSQISPYVYSLNNPIINIDPNGKDPIRDYLGSLSDVVSILNNNVGKSYWELSKVFSKAKIQYIATEKSGFLDLEHFFAAAQISSQLGVTAAILGGEGIELSQYLENNISAYNQEDPRSNLEGAEFGNTFSEATDIATNFEGFISNLIPLESSDPRIAADKVYIPQNIHEYKSNPLPTRVPQVTYLPLIGFIPILNYSPSYGASPENHNKELEGF